jgi:glycerophosphoryl diester phosphodiesterase
MGPTRPLVIAHRGASAEAPENTLAAFRLALAQGADLIELDVRRSRDGALLVFHDETTAHVEHPGRPLAALTFAELRALDLGEGQRIPTLEEACAWAADEGIALNIEIKVDGIEQAVVEAVGRAGMTPQVLISSFRTAVLRRLGQLAPELALGVLSDPEVGPGENALEGGSPLPLLRELGAAAWHPNERQLVSAAQVRQVQAAGARVYPWTVDDPARSVELLAWGVDGIITNRPGALVELIRNRLPPG